MALLKHHIQGPDAHTIWGKNEELSLQEQNTTEEFCFKGELQIILFYNFQRVGKYPIKDYVDMQFSHDYILTKHLLQN